MHHYCGWVIMYFTPRHLHPCLPFWTCTIVKTRLKPLAQWSFYSSAYSKCSFPFRLQSKSNSFKNRKSWRKLFKNKRPNLYGDILLRPRFMRGYSYRIHLFHWVMPRNETNDVTLLSMDQSTATESSEDWLSSAA